MADSLLDIIGVQGKAAEPATNGSLLDVLGVRAPAQNATPVTQSQRDAVQLAQARSELPNNIGNLLYGATKGLADTVQGPAQLLAHAFKGAVNSAPNPSWNPLSSQFDAAKQYVNDKVGQFDNHLSDQEKQYQADTPGSGAAGLGRITAGVVPFLASGGSSAAAQLPSIGAKIASSAVKSGMFGAAQPVNNVQQSGADDDFLQKKALKTGIGAAAGAAVTPLASGLARLISPKTSPEVQTLLNNGVTPTPGQILGGGWAATEDKLTSVPILGDMIKNAQRRGVEDVNVAAYNKALNPIGETASGAVGRDGVQEVKTKLSDAYNDLLPKLQFKADPQFGADVTKLSSMASSMPAPQAAQFENILKNKVVSRLGPQGTMDGTALKGVESELTGLAKGYKSDPSFDNRQLGDAVNELLTSVRGNLSRSNPAYADQLAKINEGYANYARIRGAAASQGAPNGVFTPAQLSAAVKSQDKSVGKGNFATGNALMQDLSDAGKNVMTKYPDSGTAGRAMLLSAGPAAAAAYASPMMAAGALGAGTLAAAPYTQMGQKLAAAILAKRPNIAAPIANAVQGASPAVGTIITPALLQMLQGQNN